jgi:hypothetical protein
MAITTVEEALNKLIAVRADWKTLVRDRRAAARAELAQATADAVTIRAADAEAVTFLQAVIAAAETPAPLKTRLAGEVALHTRIKADAAAEE